MNKETKKVVNVSWCYEDVKTIKPKWSKKRCEKFLDDNKNNITERSIEFGWEVIKQLIQEEKQ